MLVIALSGLDQMYANVRLGQPDGNIGLCCAKPNHPIHSTTPVIALGEYFHRRGVVLYDGVKQNETH